MNRFILLGLAAASLLPIVLPPAEGDSGRAFDSGSSQAAVKTTVTVERLEPPQSLREAMIRADRTDRSQFGAQGGCLAQAVYFEARSESPEGQLAVAQVVLNRVSSPFWPDSICGVVFENDHRRHACQFSFACDGVSDQPQNPQAWKRAKRLAAVALSGLWKDVTDRATHYHADYVAPAWRNRFDMTVTFGRHIFYRDGRRILALAADLPDFTAPPSAPARFQTVLKTNPGNADPAP